MRFLLIIISFSVVAFSQQNIVLLEKQKISGTVTSDTAKDIASSKEHYSLKYYIDTQDVLYLIGLSYQPLQTVGNTSLYSFPVEIKQEMEKVELGIAYKLYLMDSLYIAPAIVYSNTDSKTFRHLNNNGTIISSITNKVDTDYSLYAIIGYKPTKITSLLLSLELNNDLLSSEYSRDYSTYQVNFSILQAISSKVLLYVQYNRLLKEKPSTSVNTGTKDVDGFSLGIGFQF